ncbi:MAG: glycosyltransferase family 4 protein [Acidimicrobiales bacterium]
MRLLFVVQRYGAEIAGGAEQHCRAFATRLAARGHDVEVLTSRAVDYLDWADRLPGGTEHLDGVTVHRLGVREARDLSVFQPIDARVVAGPKPVPYSWQLDWLRAQGPELLGLAGWLDDRSPELDVVVFFTYLYWPSSIGLPVAGRHRPTVLHPTAHDEPPFYLPLFRYLLHQPSGLAYSTPEEQALVESLVPPRRPNAVVGIGVDRDVVGDEAAFRSRYDLGDRPYLLYLGRIDLHKGAQELFDFFAAYRSRHPGQDLVLAMVGEPLQPLPYRPDVVVTGFVPDDMRAGALAGAAALVVPSYFESFSMVLTEAWAAGRPALVQGHCAVLDGQARRSGGAIAYRGFAEFEAATEALLGDPSLASALGEAGRAYVTERYDWDVVLDRYERLLGEVAMSRPPRRARSAAV